MFQLTFWFVFPCDVGLALGLPNSIADVDDIADLILQLFVLPEMLLK